MSEEQKKFSWIVGIFLLLYFLPIEQQRLQDAIIEGFVMLNDYAREHVLLCLIPAFFIAGAMTNFISQGAVMKYFGSQAKKWLSYSVASVSGTILAVCSCTVLPLFAGIYKRGAGIGPATAFLFSGPAINVLAIAMTAKVLGVELGVVRAVAAIFFSVVLGLLMHAIYHKEEQAKGEAKGFFIPEDQGRPLWQNGLFFFVLVLILIVASSGLVYKWYILAGLALALTAMIMQWFVREELREWMDSSWDFAKLILPMLVVGVFIAGLLLGRPGHEALIPSEWVAQLVGGNSIQANLFAAVVGTFMYFATLTEVPILQGLLGAGMGKGPALALLLAGPALSLPNILVLIKVMGGKKTAVYVSLVVLMSTLAGLMYGSY